MFYTSSRIVKIIRNRHLAALQAAWRWTIESKVSNTVDLDAHVAAILRVIGNAKSNFKHLPQGSTISLLCGITVNQGPGGPSIVFSPQMVAILAELGAEISIDLYCLNCPEA